MPIPPKLRGILFYFVLLAVPVLLLQANLKAEANLNPFDRLLLRICAPVQAGVTAALAGIHRGWRRYVYLVGVETQNERLEQENRTLRLKYQEAQRSLSRMNHFERLLQFRAERGVETVGVRAIGRDASLFVRAIRVRVDRGKDALRPGLPVITADGVVGRVGHVFGSYSDVILAVDPKSAIDISIQPSGGRGVLRGIEGSNRYLCRIDYLLHKEAVKVGDLVLTSGVANVFPKDLPVGRISRVTRQHYGLYQEVEVTPAVDFTSLREMLVIVTPPPPPVEPPHEGELPARGLIP